jgi:parallel beta-helix repeat protein
MVNGISPSNPTSTSPLIFSEPLEFTRSDIEIVGNPSLPRRPCIEVKTNTSFASPSTSSASQPSTSAATALGRRTSGTISPSSNIDSSSGNNNNKNNDSFSSICAAIKIGPNVSEIKFLNINIAHVGPSVGEKQFAITISDARGCTFESCDIHSESGTAFGISGTNADVFIGHCKISACLTGIHISSGATGQIYQNTICGTGLAGVLVKRKASPRIVSNVFENNRQAGIFFFRAGGLAEKNTITGCGGCAFVIKGGSAPTVRRNRIQLCAQAGILVSDESRGTISENVILRMRKTGILIKTNANPTVVRNQVSQGQEAGIYIFENGGGHIEENEVSDNANAGIIVTTGGNPFVVGNRVLRNTYEGIWVCNGGKGRFERNVLEANGRKGPVDIQEGCEVDWS